MPERPQRLDTIFRCYEPPLFFVTFNTHDRKALLSNARVHNAFCAFANEGLRRQIAVGRYVIMPDHVHLFVQGAREFVLSQWVRLLKRHLSTAIPQPLPHWQDGFFDHLIRHEESYSEKWEYVRRNPVRAGLAAGPEEWPWQGEIALLDARRDRG